MSSRRRIRRKACIGKRQYANQIAAAIALRGAYKRGEKNMRMYRCPFCKHWHIGHYA